MSKYSLVSAVVASSATHDHALLAATTDSVGRLMVPASWLA
jgi:hypothetical protein